MDQAAFLAQFPPSTAAPDAPPYSAHPPAPAPPSPSYAEMITAAILWGSSQGKEGGSSKRAIAKYIDRVYTNLPPSHSALLTHHLKRLKSTGHLVMVKNSYQLASALPPPRSDLPPPPAVGTTHAAFAPNAGVHSVGPSPAKRGPGRPPKPKSVTTPIAPGSAGGVPSVGQVAPVALNPVVDNGSGLGLGTEQVKKRRGRPPKQQHPMHGGVPAEVPFIPPISEVYPTVAAAPTPMPVPTPLVNGEASSGQQKRRGRPPKQQNPAAGFVQPVAAPAAAYVQPFGPVQVSEPVVEMPRKRPGRPPKTYNVNVNVAPPAAAVSEAAPAAATMGVVVEGSGVVMGRRRGRPRKNAVVGGGQVSVSVPGAVVGKKRRGRPPRKMDGVVGGVGMGMGMGMGVGMKRRGRPPKYADLGLPKMARVRTGKPVGRPRKDGSAPRSRSHQGVDNEELMSKFQLIQSKIREAVVIIRPSVTNESAALMALQELEELATVQLTANPVSQPEAAPPQPDPTPAVPVNMAAPGMESQHHQLNFTGGPTQFNVTEPYHHHHNHGSVTMEEGEHTISWMQSDNLM